MALRLESYVCRECGKRFTKWVGGIITTPAEMEFRLHPRCSACKAAKAKAILYGNAKK